MINKRTLTLIERTNGALRCAFIDPDGFKKVVHVWSSREMLKMLAREAKQAGK